MFKHILFPTDTSDQSNSGFSVAVNLAQRHGGCITLLNVHEEFLSKDEMQYLRINPNQYQEFIRDRAVVARKSMERLISDAGVADVCDILIREGKPRQMILEVASEIGADLIVMSSNGRSNLKEQLIGSTAEYIVHQSKIPVLVIK